jgi:hypothetical protein
MEKPFSYYYGLCILDALNRETAPPAPPMTKKQKTSHVSQVFEKANKKLELRDETIKLMKSPQTVRVLAYRRQVDAYFGDCHAATLFNLVNQLYNVAHTHMLQRATDGPYDIHPNEFAVFLTQRVRYVMIDGEPPASDSDEDNDENDPDWQPN